MSEYQTPEAFDRLLADTSVEAPASALISSVRKDPFAVVLLDEFEKAAATGAGISSSRSSTTAASPTCKGVTVDFRRSVIILTSNIGSPLAQRVAASASIPAERSVLARG